MMIPDEYIFRVRHPNAVRQAVFYIDISEKRCPSSIHQSHRYTYVWPSITS